MAWREVSAAPRPALRPQELWGAPLCPLLSAVQLGRPGICRRWLSPSGPVGMDQRAPKWHPSEAAWLFAASRPLHPVCSPSCSFTARSVAQACSSACWSTPGGRGGRGPPWRDGELPCLRWGASPGLGHPTREDSPSEAANALLGKQARARPAAAAPRSLGGRKPGCWGGGGMAAEQDTVCLSPSA